MASQSFDCIPAIKALGEESRMRIVRLLLARPHCVMEISESLGLTAYNVSKHLRILREAGLVELEKRGQKRVYSLVPALSAELSEPAQILDLGCCQFDFSKLPE